MSDSSTPTPIPSIKRVDSDISELRHEIAQIREVLEQVSEIQLRSAEMNNRLLEALDRTAQERNEQANQFVERDQFMELVRKTAREEIAQSGKTALPAAPLPKQGSFFGSLQERRTLWLAIPLILALFASAAAGYRLFNKPSESTTGASDRVSQSQVPPPAPEATPETAQAAAVPPSEPAQSVATAPTVEAPEPSAPAQVAQSQPLLSQDEPLPPQDDSLRVQELNPNPPSALTPSTQDSDIVAKNETDSSTTQAATTQTAPGETATSDAAASEETSVSVAAKAQGEPPLVVETSVSPTSATSRLFIPTDEEPAEAPSGLESKPGPDLSALWEQDQPMTLGTVAASAAASNALEPSTGVVQATPETMTVTPSLEASSTAAAPAPAPVPKPSVEATSEPAAGNAAPAVAESTQIATTTVPEQSEPALPPIRPEVAMVLQRNLKRLGYYTGEVDGSAGPMTRKAIESFQSSIGNEPTGVFTPDEMFRLAQEAERAGSQ